VLRGQEIKKCLPDTFCFGDDTSFATSCLRSRCRRRGDPGVCSVIAVTADLRILVGDF
jgi:hypothetical protein